jgi:exopolysaccharide biosynthesis polyprenyl glycosylphosphotransferase
MLPAIRQFKIWKMALLTMLDFLCLNIGIGILYLIRFVWFTDKFDSARRLNSSQYFGFILFFSLLTVLLFAFLGVYDTSNRKTFRDQFTGIVVGVLLVVFSFVSFFFFYEFNLDVFPNGVPVSRFILLGAGFLALLSVAVGRILFYFLSEILFSLNYGKINIAIIGDEEQFLRPKLKKMSYIGEIVEYPILNLDILNQLQSKIMNRELGEIYTFGNQSSMLESRLALLAERYKVNFVFSPQGFSQFQFFGLKPLNIEQKLFLEVVHSNLDGWKIIFKRLFDLVFAALVLILFSPVYLIIALIVWLEDRGPIFYFSERVGPDGKVFMLWKFRRMKAEFCTSESSVENLEFEKKLIEEKDLRNDGVLYKIKDDPRNTKIGKFIERTSLDELPQFINVLLGNMSVVGPRPHQPRDVARYEAYHYKVLNIKPGITGMAQINGRSDLKFDQEVEFDCWYIENWSFFLDLKIVAKTPFALLKKHEG